MVAWSLRPATDYEGVHTCFPQRVQQGEIPEKDKFHQLLDRVGGSRDNRLIVTDALLALPRDCYVFIGFDLQAEPAFEIGENGCRSIGGSCLV